MSTASRKTALNLKQDPFENRPDLRFYHAFESFEQRLEMLRRTLTGPDGLILVIGEAGSGKTTLLKRYLTSADVQWKTAQLRLPAAAESDRRPDAKNLPVILLKTAPAPAVLVDDAHRLSQTDLTFMIRESLAVQHRRKIQRLVLFGEPILSARVSAIAESVFGRSAVTKVFLPPLNREQVAAYLAHRLLVAGYAGKPLFSSATIRDLHRRTGGLPGRINQEAGRRLPQALSETTRPSGVFSRRRRLAALVVLAVLLAAVAVVQTIGPRPSSSSLPPASRGVVRVKITKPPAVAVPQPAAVKSAPAVPSRPQTAPAGPPPASEATAPPSASTNVSQTAPAAPALPGPTGAPPPTRPEGRDIHREPWLLDQDPSHYTLQLIGFRREASILQFVNDHRLPIRYPVAYYRTRHLGRDWYPLLCGMFATRAEAQAAVRALPAEIQRLSPWIRRMSAVQKAIASP
jgi:DamX protein